MTNSLVVIALLTAAYLVFAQLGHQLALPPSFASIVWPPAGLALAGVLLFGNRVCVAVFLASILPHLSEITSALGDAPTLAEAWRATALPLLIAVGAAVQALVGGALIRRSQSFPNQLNDIPQISKLLLLGGPVACLVEASVGTASLWRFSGLPAGNLLETWITWWCGDCMGVFVFAPPLLLWATPRLQNRIRRGLAVTIGSVIGLSITMSAVAYTKSMQQEMLAQKFQEAAHLLADDFEEAFKANSQPILATQAFMASAPRSEQDFKAFARQIGLHRSGLLALGWLTTPTDPEALAPYDLWQGGGDDVPRAILYSLKFPDIAADQSKLDAMRVAKKTGALALSGDIALGGGGHGLLLFAPVYQDGAPPSEDNFRGYVVGLIRLTALIDDAFHEQGAQSFHYWLFDDSDGGTILASNRTADATGAPSSRPGPALQTQTYLGHAVTLGFEQSQNFANRAWRFVALPSPSFVEANRFKGSWVILLGGFFVTGLLSCFVMITTGRESALRDVIERHTFALRDSELKYRTLTETTHDWIWETDRSGRLTYVSPRIKPLLGYDVDDMQGRQVQEIIPASYRDVVHQDFMLAASERRAVELLVIPHLHRLGHLVDLETSAVPIFGPSGEVIGFRGSSRDITERKSAEDRLRRQYESLRLLNNLAASPDAALRDRIQEALRLGARHLGLDVAILSDIDQDVYTVLQHVAPPEMGLTDGSVYSLSDSYCAQTCDLQNVVAVAQRQAADPKGHPCYEKVRLESYIGAPIIVQNRLIGTVNFSSPHPSARQFDDGDIEFMRLLSRWIGAAIERDDTLHALESARDRVEAILSNTPVGIAILDQDRRLRQVNQAFRSVFHILPDEEITGHSVREFYGDDGHYEWVGKTAYPMLSRGEIFKDEAVMRRRDGTTIWIRMVARMVADGPSRAVLWAVEDISEQKAAAERLNQAHQQLEQQTRELARSNAELEQFAYVASHDLRQPLRQIASYVTLLEREYADKLDDDGREFIAFARTGAARMDRLIVDLLEYSRIGRKTRSMQALALQDVISEALFNLAPAIADAKAQVSQDVAADLPTLHGDAIELVRLFQNLVGNALKYCPAERPPVVRISAVRAADQTLCVTVADNGIGIPADQYDRVFGIFQRLHGRNQYEGTGIGLAVCKKIVEHHKGKIWLDSVEGEGTRFHVSLPIGAVHAAS